MSFGDQANSFYQPAAQVNVNSDCYATIDRISAASVQDFSLRIPILHTFDPIGVVSP